MESNPEGTADAPAEQTPADSSASPADQPSESTTQTASEPATQAASPPMAEVPAEGPVPAIAEAPTPAPAAEPEAASQPSEPKPAPPKAAGRRPPPPRKPGAAYEPHFRALFTQLYAEYDLQEVESGVPAARILDLWALPDELKGGAPPVATEGASKGKPSWTPRLPLEQRPRDYRLYVHISTTKEPAWTVPGKDVQAIGANRGWGLLLLMADQKGYFLPSGRLADFAESFSTVPAAPLKISATKLRKGAVARFFSLAGFARELAEARRR